VEEPRHVRATTAFNRILRIPGATVTGVAFTPKGIVVGLRRRRGKLRCPCGWQTRARYDRSVRRWRHLDLGGPPNSPRRRRPKEPEITAIEYVRNWFGRHLPGLREAVNRIVFSPILAKTVATGGDVLASEFKRRIGG